ncbi:MAG: hypothetical protein WAV00_01085 [Nocardioides sp.]
MTTRRPRWRRPKALSKEVGPHGIRVVTVDPGPVATDLRLGAGGVANVVAGATGQSADDIAGEPADPYTPRSGRATHSTWLVIGKTATVLSGNASVCEYLRPSAVATR